MEDQLVAWHIGGLRIQIQQTMNLFDPISMLVAHQRRVQIEKQLGQISSGGLLTDAGSSMGGISHPTGGSGLGQ